MSHLSKADIRSALKGCVAIEEGGGALRFQRMPAATLAWYRNRSEAARVRAESPAGVVLDLVSDTATIALEAKLEPGARGYAWIDLYCDGLFVATAGAADPQDRLQAEFTVPGAAPGKKRRLQLYFPQTKVLALRSLSLGDGCCWEPAPPRPLLLALGDSITQGMDCRHPSLTYLMTAARLLDMDVLSQAVGGHVFLAESLPEKPVDAVDHILVAFGTNDWSGSRDPVEARRYLEQVRRFYPDTPMTVLEPLWREREEGAQPRRNDQGLTLEDYRGRLRDLVAPFARTSLLPREALLPAEPRFLADGLHPNTEGHLIYGQNVAAALCLNRCAT